MITHLWLCLKRTILVPLHECADNGCRFVYLVSNFAVAPLLLSLFLLELRGFREERLSKSWLHEGAADTVWPLVDIGAKPRESVLVRTPESASNEARLRFDVDVVAGVWAFASCARPKKHVTDLSMWNRVERRCNFLVG